MLLGLAMAYQELYAVAMIVTVGSAVPRLTRAPSHAASTPTTSGYSTYTYSSRQQHAQKTIAIMEGDCIFILAAESVTNSSLAADALHEPELNPTH